MVICPNCGNPIYECHCDAKAEIIGGLDRETNKWVYEKDKNNYDFNVRHFCKKAVGLNKK